MFYTYEKYYEKLVTKNACAIQKEWNWKDTKLEAVSEDFTFTVMDKNPQLKKLSTVIEKGAIPVIDTRLV